MSTANSLPDPRPLSRHLDSWNCWVDHRPFDIGPPDGRLSSFGSMRLPLLADGHVDA